MSLVKLGVNAAEQFYYTQTTLTIDMMKGSSRWLNDSGGWPTTFEDYVAGRTNPESQDWLPGLPAGTAVYCIVKECGYTNVNEPPVVENFPRPLKSGKYVLTWTGSATCIFFHLPAGVSNVVVNANRCEVTFPTAEVESLAVRVANGTGAAIDVTDVKVFHIDDEAALNAGKIFRPEILQKYKGVSSIRALDLINPMRWGMFTTEDDVLIQPLATNALPTSALRTMTSRRWGRFPAAALGKLAMEVSEVNGNKPIDLWITVPCRMPLATVTEFFTQLYATHTIGKVEVEAGNEIWNTLFPFGYQMGWYYQVYLNGEEPGGNGVQRDVYNADGSLRPKPYVRSGSVDNYTWVDDLGNSMSVWETFQSLNAHQAVDFWLAAEAVYGRSRVTRVIAGHNFNDYYGSIALKTVTTKLGASGTIATKLDAYATASYIFHGETDGAGGANPTRADTLLANKFYLNTQQQYFDALKFWIDNKLFQSHVSNKALLTSTGSSAVLKGYEGYRHTNNMIMQGGFGAMMRLQPSTTDNSITIDLTQGDYYSTKTRDQIWDTGEVLRVISNNSPFDVYYSTYTGDGNNAYFNQFNTIRYIRKQVFVRRLSTDKITLHPTSADAIAGTNTLTLNTNVVFEGANITRLSAMEIMQRDFAKSELGRQLFVYWWNKCIKPHYDEINLYTAIGAWNDGFGASWGLIESDNVADHPAAAQARKMNNIGTTCAELLV